MGLKLIKFDISNTDVDPIEAAPFILGASTHPGEEEILLNAYKRLQDNKNIKLFQYYF